MCDDVSDRANNELMSLLVRYVTDSGIVREAQLVTCVTLLLLD